VKRRLLRSVVGAVVAAALAVSATAQPVQARDVKPAAVDPYSIIIEIGISLLGKAFGGGGVSEAELNAAVAQITAQIEQTKTDIINHVDAIASAEVQACARTHTIEFKSINSMSPTVLQLWAQRATECATLATAYLRALTSGQAVDNIGWVVGEIFTIVIAARTKARLTEGLDLVRQDELSAFTSVRDKLTPPERTSFGTNPQCVTWWQLADPSGFLDYLYYTCYAYNGDNAYGAQAYWAGTGVAAEGPIDYEGVRVQATRRTSRALAISTLAALQNVHPIM
jgi:hypothetical protein